MPRYPAIFVIGLGFLLTGIVLGVATLRAIHRTPAGDRGAKPAGAPILGFLSLVVVLIGAWLVVVSYSANWGG